MLIFYIVCACIIFTLSGIALQLNRLAIYRRHIIRQRTTEHMAEGGKLPFNLSDRQEKKVTHCFLKGISIKKCMQQL